MGSEIVSIVPITNPAIAVMASMGPTPPAFTPPQASWNTIERPRRRSLTEYGGEAPAELEVDILLDLFPFGDVEPVVARIEAWARRNGVETEPTTIQVLGNAIPHQEYTWVLTGVDSSGIVERRPDGHRCRQELQLSFLEYVAPDLTVVAPPPPAVAAQGRAPDPPAARTYTVKRGDTLSAIASRLLGNANRWHEIADANSIRDPKKLAIGAVLRIPG